MKSDQSKAAKRVKMRRTGLGLTASDVAKASGISRAALSGFELGQLTLSATPLELIAQELGLNGIALCCTAGRVPDDVIAYLLKHPGRVAELRQEAAKPKVGWQACPTCRGSGRER